MFAIAPCRSPLSVRVRSGSWATDSLLLVQATSVPQKLAHVAARHAFWKMPKTGLIKLGHFIQAPVDKGSMAALLLSLAAKLLDKELDEDEKLQILRHRLPRPEEFADALQDSAAIELLPQDDQEALLQHSELTAAAGEIVADVKEVVKKIAAARRAAAPPETNKSRKYPPRMEITSDMNIATANSYLPTGCRMTIDRLDQGWRLQPFGGRWLSRSQRLYGYEQAAWLLIRIAWTLAIDEGFETACPYDFPAPT